MTMHKICNKINYSTKEWLDYILWRNYGFRSFESLDSTVHNSIFNVEGDSDWNHVITIGNFLTDVVDDYNYSELYCRSHGGDEILNFDYIENETIQKKVIGYEILDGHLHYSLLTNFGNDIKIVNSCLSSNALIRHKDQVIAVHKWFLDNMPTDNHVVGSRILTVYEKTVHRDRNGHH